MIEFAHQRQRGADLRGIDLFARLRFGGGNAHQDGQPFVGGRRGAAPLRVQRAHDVTLLVKVIDGLVGRAVRADKGDDGLRHRVAFVDGQFKGVGQDALDGHELDGRLPFQVAFDAHQIQRHQVFARLGPGPGADGFGGQDAIGLHVNLLDGEGVVFVDRAV